MIKKYYLPFSHRKKISLYSLAYIDPFTGLGNYYYFCKEGSKFIQNYHEQKYILILDIEKFRAFNSYYGHDTGRKLIIKLSKRLVKILNNYNNIISWFSNDIFAILIETNGKINNIGAVLTEGVVGGIFGALGGHGSGGNYVNSLGKSFIVCLQTGQKQLF